MPTRRLDESPRRILLRHGLRSAGATDQEKLIDVEATSQQRSGQIGVDLHLEPPHRAVGGDRHREASPAGADDQRAGIDQHPQTSQLDDRVGLRLPGGVGQGSILAADYDLGEDGDDVPLGQRILQRQLEHVTNPGTAIVGDHDVVLGGDLGQYPRGGIDVLSRDPGICRPGSQEIVLPQCDQDSHADRVANFGRSSIGPKPHPAMRHPTPGCVADC